MAKNTLLSNPNPQPRKLLVETILPDVTRHTGLEFSRLVALNKVFWAIKNTFEKYKLIPLEKLIVPTQEPEVLLLQQLYVGVVAEHLPKFPVDGFTGLFMYVGDKPGYPAITINEMLKKHHEFMSVFLGNIPLAERPPYEKYRVYEQAIRAHLAHQI